MKKISAFRIFNKFPFSGDFFKNRCNGETLTNGTNGSSSAYHHPAPPLSQLREMLTTSADAHPAESQDVKDLSFRTNQPQPAAVITSATTSVSSHAMDTDYDSRRSPTNGSLTMGTPAPRITTANIQHIQQIGSISPSQQSHEGVLRTVRMRKLSETSTTDVDHGNSYKFKNYIQQRFTHENYHSEESMQSSQCATENDKDHDKKSSSSPSSSSNHHSRDECNTTSNKINGIHHEIKNEIVISNSPPSNTQQQHQLSHQRSPRPSSKANNAHSGVNNGSMNGNQTILPHHSIPIPIFACHTQGFYIPLNVDYDILIPFLGGLDLLNKTFNHLPPLHPISINVNYTPALIKNAISTTNFIKPKVEGLVNGW